MFLNRHALRVIRERTGLTVTDLATRVDIKQPHLSNIEAGRRSASPALIEKFALALDIPAQAITSTSAEPITRKDVKGTAA